MNRQSDTIFSISELTAFQPNRNPSQAQGILTSRNANQNIAKSRAKAALPGKSPSAAKPAHTKPNLAFTVQEDCTILRMLENNTQNLHVKKLSLKLTKMIPKFFPLVLKRVQALKTLGEADKRKLQLSNKVTQALTPETRKLGCESRALQREANHQLDRKPHHRNTGNKDTEEGGKDQKGPGGEEDLAEEESTLLEP